MAGATASIADLSSPRLANSRAAGQTMAWADDSSSDVAYGPRVTQSRHEEQVVVQVFDQLIVSDGRGNLSPGLAKAWRLAPDARPLQLRPREKVRFHDGPPFDAEAVKLTFDSIVDPRTGSQGAADMIGPDVRTEILGGHEVRIHYRGSNAGAVDSPTESELSIVSPCAVERLRNTGFAQAPVGTGPFRFASR